VRSGCVLKCFSPDYFATDVPPSVTIAALCALSYRFGVQASCIATSFPEAPADISPTQLTHSNPDFHQATEVNSKHFSAAMSCKENFKLNINPTMVYQLT